MNKEEIKEFAKQQFIENVMTNIDSALIFTYIQQLEQENKEQEEYIKYWQNEYDKKVEVIDKAIEYIEYTHKYSNLRRTQVLDILLGILKGDSNE